MSHSDIGHHNCGHNHGAIGHKHSHSHSHPHSHSHEHSASPEQIKTSATSSKALDSQHPDKTQKNKKQASSFTPLQCAALLTVAGAASYVFFQIYNKGSVSYKSYQVPFEEPKTNPLNSGTLTFKAGSVATAMLVESLFFLKQAAGNVSLKDFTSLAKNSPSIASRYIHDWQEATSTLASSLVCAKNNGKTTIEQDKIALYAAHKIAPKHNKQELIETALTCRDLNAIDKKQFKENADAYLQVLDDYQEIVTLLKNHDPLSARILTWKMSTEPKDYQESSSLQQSAHANIDKKYDNLAQRSDASILFGKSVDACLNNKEFFQDGKLLPDASFLILKDLIKFREAAFKYTEFNQNMGNLPFWNESIQKILAASALTPEQTAKWYSQISSQGKTYTPWLSILLQNTDVSQNLVTELHPSRALPTTLQQEHKIIALDAHVKSMDLNENTFNFALEQIDQILQMDLKSDANKKNIQSLIAKLVTTFHKGSTFLDTEIYIPPREISKKCLELVNQGFHQEVKVDRRDVLLPFLEYSMTNPSWLYSIERQVNTELYKGQIPADTATTLITQIVGHKQNSDWNLRLLYLEKVINAAANPTQAQLENWVTSILSIKLNDTDMAHAKNIITGLLEKTNGIGEKTLRTILSSKKWSDFIVSTSLAKRDLGMQLDRALSSEEANSLLDRFNRKPLPWTHLQLLYLQKIMQTGSNLDQALLENLIVSILNHVPQTVPNNVVKDTLTALIKKMQDFDKNTLEKLLRTNVLSDLILSSYITKMDLNSDRFEIAMKELSKTSYFSTTLLDEIVDAYSKQSDRFLTTVNAYLARFSPSIYVLRYDLKVLEKLKKALSNKDYADEVSALTSAIERSRPEIRS